MQYHVIFSLKDNKCEDYWVDYQNAIDYFLDNEILGEKQSKTKDGKIHWLITSVKPKGIKIDSSNQDLVKWVVDFGTKEDIWEEWDFENHCILKK